MKLMIKFSYISNLLRRDVSVWVEEYVTVYYDSIFILIYQVTIMSESQEIKEIKKVYAELETLYNTYFPKSDPSLIHDLLRRLKKIPTFHWYIWLKRLQNQAWILKEFAPRAEAVEVVV